MITNHAERQDAKVIADDNILIFGSSGAIGVLTVENLKGLSNYLKCLVIPNEGTVSIKKQLFCINRRYVAKNTSFVQNKGVPASLTLHKEIYRLVNVVNSLNTTATQNNFTLEEQTIEYFWNRNITSVTFQTQNDKVLKINFEVLVVQVILPLSSSWLNMIPLIFEYKRSINPAFPDLSNINTMVCTIGSTAESINRDSTTRSFVDYELIYGLAKLFSNTPEKRLVLVTSFNNPLICHLSSYFDTKARLEYSVRFDITDPPLKEIYILRPGPILERQVENSSILTEPSWTLSQLWAYKKKLVKTKFQLLQNAFTSKNNSELSEGIAQLAYHVPGSNLLGYPVKARSIAHVASLKALQPAKNASETCEVITSKQMDAYIIEQTL